MSQNLEIKQIGKPWKSSSAHNPSLIRWSQSWLCWFRAYLDKYTLDLYTQDGWMDGLSILSAYSRYFAGTTTELLMYALRLTLRLIMFILDHYKKHLADWLCHRFTAFWSMKRALFLSTGDVCWSSSISRKAKEKRKHWPHIHTSPLF